MFLKKLINIQQLKLNKPTSNTKIISLSNIISSTFSISILSNTPSHPHIQLSFAFVFSTLLPSSNLLTIPSYIYIYIPYQTVPESLSNSISPLKLHPHDPVSIASINFWLRINTGRVINMEARGTHRRVCSTLLLQFVS